MQGPDLIIFDLAGTTVEDRGQVPNAFSSALAQFGIALSENQIRSIRGATKRQAILDLLPECPDRIKMAEDIYAAFCKELVKHYQREGVQAIPGAEFIFHTFQDKGVKIALNTGFDQKITKILLDSLGWKKRDFNAIICGDDVPKGRPFPYLIFHAMEAAGSPSVHQVANIGDTALDLMAGHHAGVKWNFGVLSGAHDQSALERAPHTAILPSVAALPEHLKEGAASGSRRR